ncbi:hypothetical protein GZH46_02243, partial [Fragariocoptes setiger]
MNYNLAVQAEPPAPNIRMGQRVAYKEYYGNEFGTVRWIGRVPQICAEWTVGVEFDNAIGEGDGSLNGRRYFVAKDCFAKFLPLAAVVQVDQTMGRPEPGTMISVMSASVRPGQMISIQRVSTVHVQHCFLNAPHRRPGHDLLAVNNRLHCQCPNCGPCAHLIKPSKSQRLGRAGKNATHMCQFSTYTCCGMQPARDTCYTGPELDPLSAAPLSTYEPDTPQPQVRLPRMGNSWIEGSGYLTTLQEQQAKLLPPEFRGSARSSRRHRHRRSGRRHHQHNDNSGCNTRQKRQQYVNDTTISNNEPLANEVFQPALDDNKKEASDANVDAIKAPRARVRSSIDNRYLYPDDNNGNDSIDSGTDSHDSNHNHSKYNDDWPKLQRKIDATNKYQVIKASGNDTEDDDDANGFNNNDDDRSSSRSSRSKVIRGLRSLIACMTMHDAATSRQQQRSMMAATATRLSTNDSLDLGYNSHLSIAGAPTEIAHNHSASSLTQQPNRSHNIINDKLIDYSCTDVAANNATITVNDTPSNANSNAKQNDIDSGGQKSVSPIMSDSTIPKSQDYQNHHVPFKTSDQLKTTASIKRAKSNNSFKVQSSKQSLVSPPSSSSSSPLSLLSAGVSTSIDQRENNNKLYEKIAERILEWSVQNEINKANLTDNTKCNHRHVLASIIKQVTDDEELHNRRHARRHIHRRSRSGCTVSAATPTEIESDAHLLSHEDQQVKSNTIRRRKAQVNCEASSDGQTTISMSSQDSESNHGYVEQSKQQYINDSSDKLSSPVPTSQSIELKLTLSINTDGSTTSRIDEIAPSCNTAIATQFAHNSQQQAIATSSSATSNNKQMHQQQQCLPKNNNQRVTNDVQTMPDERTPIYATVKRPVKHAKSMTKNLS